MTSFVGYTVNISLNKGTEPIEFKFLPEKLTWDNLITMISISTDISSSFALYYKYDGTIQSVENQEQLQQLLQQVGDQGTLRFYGDRERVACNVFSTCTSIFTRLGSFVEQHKEVIQTSRRLNRAIGVLASLITMDQTKDFEKEFQVLEMMVARKEKKRAGQAADEEPKQRPDFEALDPRFVKGVFFGKHGRFDRIFDGEPEFGPHEAFGSFGGHCGRGGRGGFGGRGSFGGRGGFGGHHGGRGGRTGFGHRGFGPGGFGPGGFDAKAHEAPKEGLDGTHNPPPPPFEFEALFRGGFGMRGRRGGRHRGFDGRGHRGTSESDDELMLGRFVTDGRRHYHRHGKCKKGDEELKDKKQLRRERFLERLATLSLSESESDDDFKRRGGRGGFGRRGRPFFFAA